MNRNRDKYESNLVNLDPRLRRLLSIAQFQPTLTYRALAMQAKLREGTAAYHLNKLREQGVIRCRPILDLSRIGLLEVGVYWNLACPSESSSETVMSRIAKQRSVGWVTRFVGDFRFHVLLYGRTLAECLATVDVLPIPKGVRIIHRATAIRVRSAMCSKGYLLSRKKVSLWQFKGEPPGHVLNNLDWRILSALNDADFVSGREVARRLGEPLSTVQRRLDALRAHGIVKTFMFDMQPDYFGFQSYRLLIAFDELSVDLQHAVEAFLSRQVMVDHFCRVFGSWDYEASIEVKDADCAGDFCEQLCHRFTSQIRDLRVLRFNGHIKQGYCDFSLWA